METDSEDEALFELAQKDDDAVRHLEDAIADQVADNQQDDEDSFPEDEFEGGKTKAKRGLATKKGKSRKLPTGPLVLKKTPVIHAYRAVYKRNKLKRERKQALGPEEKPANIYTSGSDIEDTEFRLPPLSRVGLTVAERFWAYTYLSFINQVDVHNMRPSYYLPIRSQELSTTDPYFVDNRWYEDFSQYGLFQSTVSSYWPPKFNLHRFEAFRRGETRFVDSSNPVEENLSFNTSTATSVPKTIMRGSQAVFEAPEGLEFLFDRQELYTKARDGSTEMVINDSDEETEVPFVRSLLPDRAECADLEIRRLGVVDETYGGSATLGGDPNRYFAPAFSDADLELLHEFERGVQEPKGKIVSSQHLERLSLFEKTVKDVLPAASDPYHMTPMVNPHDQESMGEYSALIEATQVIVQDMWQKLVDHHTRVERQKRRLAKQKEMNGMQGVTINELNESSISEASTQVYSVQPSAISSPKRSAIASDADQSDSDHGDANSAINISIAESPVTAYSTAATTPQDFGALVDLVSTDSSDDAAFDPSTSENGAMRPSGTATDADDEARSETDTTPTESEFRFDSGYLNRAPEEEEGEWLERLTTVVSDSYLHLTVPVGRNESLIVNETVHLLEPTEGVVEEVQDTWVGQNDYFAELDAVPFGIDTILPINEIEENDGVTWVHQPKSKLASFTPTVPPAPAINHLELSDLRPLSRPFTVTRITHELIVSDVVEWLDEMLNGLLKSAECVALDRRVDTPSTRVAGRFTRSFHIVLDEVLGIESDEKLKNTIDKKVKLIYTNYPFQTLWPTNIVDGVRRNNTVGDQNPLQHLLDVGQATLLSREMVHRRAGQGFNHGAPLVLSKRAKRNLRLQGHSDGEEESNSLTPYNGVRRPRIKLTFDRIVESVRRNVFGPRSPADAIAITAAKHNLGQHGNVPNVRPSSISRPSRQRSITSIPIVPDVVPMVPNRVPRRPRRKADAPVDQDPDFLDDPAAQASPSKRSRVPPKNHRSFTPVITAVRETAPSAKPLLNFDVASLLDSNTPLPSPRILESFAEDSISLNHSHSGMSDDGLPQKDSQLTFSLYPQRKTQF